MSALSSRKQNPPHHVDQGMLVLRVRDQKPIMPMATWYHLVRMRVVQNVPYRLCDEP